MNVPGVSAAVESLRPGALTVLFFDDRLIARRSGLRRQLGQAQLLEDSVLDDDISAGTWNRPTVFRTQEGSWRALYTGATYHEGVSQSLGILVAGSDDGESWSLHDFGEQSPAEPVTRPAGRSTIRQRRNQALATGPGGPAFVDRWDPDPSRRLKYFSANREPGAPMPFSTSPDGLDWREAGTWGVGSLDAPVSVFRNLRRGCYVVCRRPMNGDRRIAFVETEDFVEFSEPSIALWPDALDEPGDEFYGLAVEHYEQMYVGLLMVLHADDQQIKRLTGSADGQLVYSYNGRDFNRTVRQPLVARSAAGRAGSGAVYPSSMVAHDDGSLRIFAGGARIGHFQTTDSTDHALLAYSLRRDGFVAFSPSGTSGRLTTRPLLVEGGYLSVNVDAPYGSVRLQLTDPEGVALAGFSFEDSRPFAGSAIAHEPTWHGDRRLDELAGQTVCVEIELVNGSLYAIRIEASPADIMDER